MNEIRGTARLPIRARSLTLDRVSLALGAVFLLAAAFYLWTAGSTYSLGLDGGSTDPYNELANAFIHLHLSVGRAPAGLLRLTEPYNPAQNSTFQSGIHDFALYNGKLFLTWGPGPVIVLLVPLHLLGFAPTASLTTSVFAIAGLAFALATLRVLLRRIGDLPLWMCVLAALTLALASAVPFMLRRPQVYEEEIAGGYCFAMAGIWLAVSAIADRSASTRRVALMSLCIGLAAASRPPLALTAVVLLPVYLALRTAQPRRSLLMALMIPVGVCVVLLLAYNQARFDNPLQYGAKYQLAGIDQSTVRFSDPSYVSPGIWSYVFSPPQAKILFPFVALTTPRHSYPLNLPAGYSANELTGGLLPMAPIVIFLVALPWIWRRRRASLGGLALPLLVLSGAGIAYLLFLSLEFFSTTERYEVDFATLLLFGALAAWLALSHGARGWGRRLVRLVGGLLAVWSCLTGLAISFTGYYNLFAIDYPGAWSTLEDVSSPLGTAITIVEGHPVLAEFFAPGLPLLSLGEQEKIVIVSPDAQKAALRISLIPGVRVPGGAVEIGSGVTTVLVRDPGRPSLTYRIHTGGGTVQIPVSLRPGLNRLGLTPLAVKVNAVKSIVPRSRRLLLVKSLSLANNS